MAWTYTGSPATSPVDLVRYRLGDVNPDNPLASDEECLQALRDEGNNAYLAAAAIAETKALSFLLRPSMEKRGDHVIQYQQQALAFQTFAETLRRQASIRTSTIDAGGISQGEKEAEERSGDRVPPFATVRLHEVHRDGSVWSEDDF
jgi:hypothetical protein